jgi:hypothetical protein
MSHSSLKAINSAGLFTLPSAWWRWYRSQWLDIPVLLYMGPGRGMRLPMTVIGRREEKATLSRSFGGLLLLLMLGSDFMFFM